MPVSGVPVYRVEAGSARPSPMRDGGAGSRNRDVALLRHSPDGSPDQSFGTDGTGILVSDFSPDDRAYAVAIQPDDVRGAGFVGRDS